MVGVAGFEPTTSCSRSRRATRLRYTPSTRWLSLWSASVKIAWSLSVVLFTPAKTPSSPMQLRSGTPLFDIPLEIDQSRRQ